jgi:hypothetical protein
MADVTIYHPQTGAEVVVPDVSVFHYRQSGWVLRSEHEAALEAAGEQPPSRLVQEPAEPDSTDEEN